LLDWPGQNFPFFDMLIPILGNPFSKTIRKPVSPFWLSDLVKSKCLIGVTEVKFFDHVFNSEGVKPDPDKITAIVNMPSPKSVKDLQRFLCMINYLSSYIPKLANETTLLRRLLKKNTSWV